MVSSASLRIVLDQQDVHGFRIGSWSRSPFLKGKVESRALVGFAFGPDASAVATNHTLNQGQPHAGSFKLLGTVQTLEHTEKLAHVLHLESRAVVPHGVDGSRLGFVVRSP
jgi:hypothetical protein